MSSPSADSSRRHSSQRRWNRFLSWIVVPVAAVTTWSSLADAYAQQASSLLNSGKKWKVKALALDANEGCAIGDLDGNGSLDVVAGRNWYPAPDFIPRPLRTIEDWNGYIQSNGDFLWDMNQDGRLDVVAGSFLPSEVHWYENPSDEVKRLGQTWPKHLLMDTKQSQNEAQLLTDVDGDGRPEWVVNSWNNKNPVLIWRLVPTEDKLPGGSKFTLQSAEIATTGNRHGMGVGDINGDGKKDLLTGAGWYEQPASNPWGQAWKYHADWEIQASIPMLVHDVDGDGKADILVGEGHNYGLFWWRQTGKDADGKIEFDKRMIDKSYSQPHALALTDLNGDGRPELISGKRYFAHNGGDPGGKDMPLIVAYEFQPATQTYSRMVLEEGHVGIGLQIATGDLDGDKQADIAVAGKSGTYLLFNPGK